MRKIYFLCILISFASQNANAQKTENYLPNANFEVWGGTNSLTSWSLTNTAASSTITQETTTKIPSSTNSIKYIPTVANQGVLGTTSAITIDTAGKYYFGIWIKTDTNAQIKPGIKIVRGSENIYSGNTYTAPDTDWHFVVFYYDFLVGDQVTCRLVPQANGLTTFYFDDASFNEGFAGGNVEWDVTNGTARAYNFYWGTQNYGGTTNGTLSENTNTSYVKSGYNSLSLVTNADASSDKRGVIILKGNNTVGNRYVHPATTRKYQGSAWIYTTVNAEVVLNIKTGTTSNTISHQITANTWTQIFSNIIELDAADDGDEVYPIIQFKTPSVTHYVDDFYLNWDGIKWEGGTSSDWDTASNWSSNMVPNSKSVVTIPSGLSNYPTAASAVTVSSVDMAAGTSLISTSTFSGTVKYTRNLADTTDDWYLVSSPVNNQDIDVFIAREELATGTGNNIGLSESYATFNDSWTYYQSGASSSGNFNPGKGHAIKLATPGDIYFEGAIRDTDVSRGLSLSGNAYNFAANPYTSYMDTAAMLAANTGVLDTETIWVWNSSTGSYDTKVTVDAYKLAPAQGFFVKSDGQAGNLALIQAHEVHNTSDTFQRTEPRPEIHLTLSDGTLSRLAKIYYINDATTGFDNGYDGEMFGGISNEFAIYSHSVSNGSGIDLAVQSLPTNNYENMVIPVGLIASATEEITFTADVMNLPPDIKVFLEDRLQNTFTRLDEENTKYEVTLAETNGVGRFFIHTTQSVLSVSSDALLTSISVYKLNNSKVRIAGLSQGKTTVKLFNILGKQLINTSFAGNGVNDISLPKLAPGVYIVNVNMETGQLNKKIIIE